MSAFWRHFEMLVGANRRFNLTRITDPKEAAVKHYADSLALARWVREAGPPFGAFAGSGISVLDLGTGGGFPAVPLAVVRPQWRVTAIDKIAKKARFVGGCARDLGLGNLRALWGRAPDWMPEQLFDLVAARAVAPLHRCLSSAAGLIRPGGLLVNYKTSTISREETGRARRWCLSHKWEQLSDFDYALHPDEHNRPRRLVIFRAPPG